MADIVEGIVISFSTRGGGQIAASEAALNKLGKTAADAATKGAFMGGVYLKAFNAIVSGAQQAIGSMAGMVQGGVNFNAKLESSKMSMAGLLYSFNDAKTSTEKWNTSLNDAVVLQAKLKQMALETAGTYEDLVEIVKIGLAPGINAGITDPGKIAEIGLMVSQANAAIGQGSHMAMQEMRAIMSGNIDRNAQVAKTLEISSEDIKKWKEAGTLVEELEKKFEGLSIAAMKSADTWTVLTSNYGDLMQQMGGEATEGAFESIKASLIEFTEGLVTVGEDGKRVFNEDLVGTIKAFADAFATTFAALVPIILAALPAIEVFARVFVGAFAAVATGAAVAAKLLAITLHEILTKIIGGFIRTAIENLEKTKEAFPKLFETLGGDVALDALNGINSGIEKTADSLMSVAIASEKAESKFADLFMTQVEGYKKVEAAEAKTKGKYSGKGGGADDDAGAKQIAKANAALAGLLKSQDAYLVSVARAVQVRGVETEKMQALAAVQDEMVAAVEAYHAEMEKLADLSLMPGADQKAIQQQIARIEAAYMKMMAHLQEKALDIVAPIKDMLLTVDPAVIQKSLTIAKMNSESAMRMQNAAELFQSSTLAMSDALVASITDGFEAGAEVLQRWGAGNFTKLMDGMVTKLATGVFGQMGTDPATGLPTVRDSRTGAVSAVTPAQMDKMNKVTTAVAGIAAAYNLYQSRESMSKSQLAKQGAVTGMQIGSAFGPIGAVVGGMIGYVAGRMFGKEVQKQSANIWVTQNPRGTMAGFQGQAGPHSNTVTDKEAQSMAEKAGSQFRKFWDIYATILMEIPGSIMPKMTGTGIKNFIGKNFAQDFENWLNGELPEEVAEKFKKNIGLALQDAFGVTAERFEALWKMTQNLDPGQAAQFWASFTSGLIAFQRATVSLKGAQDLLNNPNGTYDPTSGTVVSGGYANQFMLELEAAAQNVFKLARAVVNLTGEEQVKAFEQMGLSIDQIAAGLVDFIANINALKEALANMFADARLEKKLEHTPDKNDQARILEAEYDKIMNKIRNAERLGLSPDDIANLSQQALGLLDRIYDLDPSKEAYDWWLEQVGVLEQVTSDALDAVGQQAIDAVGRLISQLQPFVDWFKGAPVDIQAALDMLEGSFTGFGDALADLIDRINSQVVHPPAGGGGGGGGGGTVTPPDGGGMTQDPNAKAYTEPQTIVVPIHVEGNIYGVEDLNRAVESAVSRVIRRSSVGY